MTADVSIIIPTYNVAPYIQRAVASAFAQQGVAVEVILVDDCSTDASWDIISRLTDPRITRIRMPHNQGPSTARNAAIAAATAPWIAVLDGDDAFHPERLQQMIRLAQEKQADIVVDNLHVRRETDSADYLMFPTDWIPASGMLDLAHFIRGNQSFFGGYALGYLKPIFSAEFLHRHKLMYDPAVSIGEDYLFLAEALSCGAKCAIHPDAYYFYTMRAGSTSHRLHSEDVDKLAHADANLWSRRQMAPAAAQAQILRIRKIQEAYAYTRLVTGIKQLNVREIWKAICLQPTALRHLWRPVWVRIQRVTRSNIHARQKNEKMGVGK